MHTKQTFVKLGNYLLELCVFRVLAHSPTIVYIVQLEDYNFLIVSATPAVILACLFHSYIEHLFSLMTSPTMI